jgi:hypothetical protein
LSSHRYRGTRFIAVISPFEEQKTKSFYSSY